jgi:HSP20 family protein
LRVKTSPSASKAPWCASTARPKPKRQFKAAYELPLDIDVTASDAKLENGVLTLKLGKRVPVSQAAQLQIN